MNCAAQDPVSVVCIRVALLCPATKYYDRINLFYNNNDCNEGGLVSAKGSSIAKKPL